MSRPRWALILCLALASSRSLAAEAEPVPAAEPAAEEPGAKPPAAKPAAAAKAKPGQDVEASKPPVPRDPAVDAVVDSKPTTPAELLRAAKILAGLGRADLAKEYLQKLLDAKPKAAQLAALAEQFGSAVFVDLAAREDLRPESTQLAEAVAAAASQAAQDPKRLAALIKQLGSPSADARYRATTALVDARAAGVLALVDVLAQPGRSAEHAQVRAALVRFGSGNRGPILAALESPDPALAVEAIRVLVQSNAQDAALWLLAPLYGGSPEVLQAAQAALSKLAGPVPDREAAARMLADRARQYFGQRPLPPASGQQPTEVWSWDAETKRPKAVQLPADDAARAVARRLARAAYTLQPADKGLRRLCLATLLEAAAYEAGLDEPLPAAAAAEAEQFELEDIEGAFEESMQGGHPAAAAAAAGILARKGNPVQLIYRESRPAPLVVATRHADRRLRAAAVAAIMELKPDRPYPGSSYVIEALEFFAATRGTRRILAAAPRDEAARQLAGDLVNQGYQVDTANTGREAVRLAIGCPDYEFALIDAGLDQPTVDILVQQLRHDGRSADLAVGLVARAEALLRAEQIARRNPRVLPFSRAHTTEALAWQVAQLKALGPREFVPLEIRQRQAAQALQWLVELSTGPARFYPVQRAQEVLLAALGVPQLGAMALPALAVLGTPDSQRALVELASRSTEPVDLRKAAAEAFGRSTRQHGVLLTTAEILRQYDRYNQSESLDQDTQTILGSILDGLEAPTEAQRGKLRSRPAAPKQPPEK